MQPPLSSYLAISRLLALIGLVGLAAAPLAAPVAAEEPQTAAIAPLSSADADDLARVEQYLRDLTTLRSRFVQVSSQGDYAEGELVLDRPGKARFDYDPPTPVLMIARGGSLLYYNRELEQASLVPLASTPLRFLTDSDVSLGRDAQIIAIERRDGTLAITLAETGQEQDGTLTLVFSEGPLVLRQWQIVDAEGTAVQVALVDPAFGVAVAASLFDYGDLDIYGLEGRERAR
jgi:outer membrane lipoprotein-sorting protein